MDKVYKYSPITFFSVTIIAIIFHIINLFVTTPVVEPEFIKHLENFKKESYRSSLPFISKMKPSIVFATGEDILPNTEGFCKMFIGMKPTIKINPIEWKKNSEIQKEMIIFHELAHCLLLKGHSPLSEDMDSPPSLMVQKVPPSRFYIQNREFYLNELFSFKLRDIPQSINTFIFNDRLAFSH